MKFDHILSQINGFGKFQMRLVLIQVLSRMTLPCHFLLNNFMAATPEHHCDVSALGPGNAFRNLTPQQQLLVGVPLDQDGTFSSCQMFPQAQYQRLSVGDGGETVPSVACQSGWVFDNRTFHSTLVTEWDLVCSRKGMNKATATAFFVGVMAGAPLFGFFSDRFGRRPLLLASYILSSVFAVFSASASSYIVFVIMRFFTGMSLAGISIIAISLNVEWFSIERRTFSGIIISMDWTIGNWLLILVAYFVNQWRILVLAVTSPLLLAIIAWRWLPESARWLLTKGRTDEAHRYILQCANINNTTQSLADITPQMLLESAETGTPDKEYMFTDLFRTPKMRQISVCSGAVMFGVAFTYYGITLNIGGFGLNIYLTQFIFATIEMPMKILVYFFLERIGRRPGEVGTLLTTGLCLFINMFIAKEERVVRTVVAVLGKALSEASFTIMFLYMTELFPTVVRQNGLGFTSFLARLGVSVSPLVMLLEDTWLPLPQVMYCAVAVGSGFMAMCLPETLNKRLPEYIEDVDKPSAQTMRRKEIQ